jgi:uncharacterized protein
LRAFLAWGGFPEVVLEQNEIIKRKILTQYVTDVALRDVISRHRIRNPRSLDQIIMYYSTNVSSLHSYNAIKNTFGISVDTVSDHTQALADAFVFFEVTRYHHNLKVQSRDPKKVYCIDTGLRRVASSSRQEDYGKLLENVVFIELLRREKKVSYFKERQEVDFVITEDYQPVEAIQVSASDLDSPETYKREVQALQECMEALKISKGMLLTLTRKEKIGLENGGTIDCIPAGVWLLGE